MKEPDDDDMDIRHFELQGILPPGHVLAVHEHLGIIVLLTCEANAPRMLGAHHFGDVELLALLPLLTSYPRYCPSELLLATFNNTKVTTAAIERAREQLDRASADSTWEHVMKPARDVLSRTRPRLADLGLKVINRVQQGYQLAPGGEKKGTLPDGTTTIR